MSVADARSRFFVDRATGMLVGLFVLIQLAVAAIALDAVTTAPDMAASHQEGDVGFSFYMVGIIIVETLVLVTVWRYSSILPDWIWTGVKWGALVSALLAAVWIAYLIHGLIVTAGLVIVAGIAGPLMVRSDTYWIVHNALAAAGTILFAMLLGGILEPLVVIAFLLLMTVWDMVAVWKSDWMEDLMSAAAGTRLPIYYILPNGLQVDTGRFRTWLAEEEGEKPDDVAAVLGVGDIAIPSGLVVSCIYALPEAARLWAVGGVVVGGAISMAVLRVSLKHSGALPALPWITTGTLSGFVVAILLSGVPLLSVLGGVPL